ncbi:hypothetical protein Tco_1000943 [Tanacetum coccineum]
MAVGRALVTEITDTVVKTVIPLQLRHPKKRKNIVADASGPSHPPKKLREDHETPSGASMGGKSRSAVQRLLARAMVDSPTTCWRTKLKPLALLKGSLFLQTLLIIPVLMLRKLKLIILPSLSVSLMLVATTVTSTVDPTTTVKEKFVESSVFGSDSFQLGGDLTRNAEVRMRAEYNIRERRRLKSVMEEKDSLLKAKDEEIGNLKASCDNDAKKEKSELGVKVADLAASVKVREQEVADLDVVVNSVKWLLTHDIELAVTKCLNSPEYLSALGAAISKAIEKGMQDGLAVGITHGKEGRVLTYVAAYNPSAEDDYFFALQQLQNVNFSVLAELKFNKDLSVDTLMNIFRLEDTLAERLDQTVIGATALSLALDVSSSRVQRMKDNITNHRSALRNVFIPLAEPLSTMAFLITMALEGTEGTSRPSCLLILSRPYGQEGVGADGQAVDGNADPFLNVNDVELNIS